MVPKAGSISTLARNLCSCLEIAILLIPHCLARAASVRLVQHELGRPKARLIVSHWRAALRASTMHQNVRPQGRGDRQDDILACFARNQPDLIDETRGGRFFAKTV